MHPALGITIFVAAVTGQRPSTIIRVAEDATLNGFKHIGNGFNNVGRRAKRFAHGVRIETRARMIVKLQRSVETEVNTLMAMSDAQRAALAVEQGEVFARVEELRARDVVRRTSREELHV